VLPPIVLWGVWLAQNHSLFEGKCRSFFSIVQQALGVIGHYTGLAIPPVLGFSILWFLIKKKGPLGFFLRASQGKEHRCGIGFCCICPIHITFLVEHVWGLAQITSVNLMPCLGC
jgi:hypothetical protein